MKAKTILLDTILVYNIVKLLRFLKALYKYKHVFLIVNSEFEFKIVNKTWSFIVLYNFKTCDKYLVRILSYKGHTIRK